MEQQQERLGMEMVSTPSISTSSPAESKAISDDISPSESSPIPPDMLSSPCAIRISFRLPFSSRELEPMEDYRYTLWKAEMHHDHTGWSLFVDTNTNPVSDIVVHSLLRSCPGGMLVELSCHCRHGDNPRYCACIDDPNLISAVLQSRRVMYRKFHEVRVEKFVKPKRVVRPHTEDQSKYYDILRRLSEAKKREAEKATGELSCGSLKTSS